VATTTCGSEFHRQTGDWTFTTSSCKPSPGGSRSSDDRLQLLGTLNPASPRPLTRTMPTGWGKREYGQAARPVVLQTQGSRPLGLAYGDRWWCGGGGGGGGLGSRHQASPAWRQQLRGLCHHRQFRFRSNPRARFASSSTANHLGRAGLDGVQFGQIPCPPCSGDTLTLGPIPGPPPQNGFGEPYFSLLSGIVCSRILRSATGRRMRTTMGLRTLPFTTRSGNRFLCSF